MRDAQMESLINARVIIAIDRFCVLRFRKEKLSIGALTDWAKFQMLLLAFIIVVHAKTADEW